MKNFVFIVQKGFLFLSRTLLTLTSRVIFSEKIMKKIPFFDQKHRLTPLEKCDFNDFETISFYSQKGFFFIYKFSKYYFYFLTENKLKESGTFLTKAWVHATFETMQNFVFLVKKSFFSI